jgi:hypothetical protein
MAPRKVDGVPGMPAPESVTPVSVKGDRRTIPQLNFL